MRSQRLAAALRALAFLTLPLVFSTCDDGAETFLADTPLPPKAAIVDGGAGGNRYFRLLPPLVKSGTPAGPLDAALLPSLTVVVCELTAAGCGGTHASFTSAGKGSAQLRIEGGVFQANWHLKDTGARAGTYRMTFLAASTQLGYADVQVVENGNQLKSVDGSQYIGVQKNGTLPIKFHVAPGAVTVVNGSTGGTVSVPDSPITLQIPAGAISGAAGITITPVAPSSIPADESGIPVLGAVDLGPDGTTFNTPITLTMPIPAGALPVPEEDLAIYLVDENGEYLELPVVIDTASNTISAQLSHFSKYVTAPAKAESAKLERKPTSEPPATGDTIEVKGKAYSSVPGRELKSAKVDIKTDTTKAKVISKTDSTAKIVILEPGDLPLGGDVRYPYQRPGGVSTSTSVPVVQNATVIKLGADTVSVRVLGGTATVPITVLDAAGRPIAGASYAAVSSNLQVAYAEPGASGVDITGMLKFGTATVRVSATGRNGVIIRDSVRVTVFRASPSIVASDALAAYGAPITVQARFEQGFEKQLRFTLDGVTMLATTDSATGIAKVTFNRLLPPGEHPVIVRFIQDDQFNATVDTARVVIGKALPTLSGTVAPANVEYGTQATLSVTFAGPITLSLMQSIAIAGIPQASITTNSAGTAQVTFEATGAPGAASIKLVFAGSSEFVPVTVSVPYTIAPRTTATVLTPSVSTVPYGGSVTLNAAVTPAVSGLPVTFSGADGVLGNATTDAAGMAALTVPITSGSGTLAFSAAMSGNTFYTGSNGATTVQVTPAPSSVSLSVHGYIEGRGVWGENLNLTAQVTPARAGTGVRFTMASGLVVGTAFTNADGHASFTIQPYDFPAGHGAITATIGDEYLANAQATTPYEVQHAQQSLQVPDVSTPTLTATELIANVTPARGGVPVQFDVNGQQVGSATTDQSGQARFPYSPAQGAGTYPIRAAIAQDCCFVAAEASGRLMLTAVATQTTLLLPPTAAPSSDIEIGAQVAPAVEGARVVITFNGDSASAFTDAAGVARRIVRTPATLGNVSVAAYVLPGPGYLFSQTSGSLAIEKPRLAITVDPVSGTYGGTVTLRARTDPAAAGKKITFRVDGTSAIGASVDAAGVAVTDVALKIWAAGTHTLDAFYPGDAVYAASASEAVTLEISKATPALALTGAMPSPQYAGNPWSFSVQLTPAVASRTLTAVVNGTTSVATTNATGVATFNMPSLTSYDGSGLIGGTVTFEGDASLEPSSVPVNFTVTKAPTLMGASAVATVVYGNMPTFMAAFMDNRAGAVVTFSLSGTVIGTAVSDQFGRAYLTPTFPATQLLPGTWPVTATYAGDGYYQPTTHTGSFTVLKRQTQANLVAPSSAVYGGTIALSAAFGEIPAGSTVHFGYNGQTIARSTDLAGMASASFVAASSGNVSVYFPGNATHDSVRVTRAITVTPAPTALSATVRSIPTPADPGYDLRSQSSWVAEVQLSPALANQWIRVSVPGAFSEGLTNAAGIATISMPALTQTGSVTAQIQYFGSATHQAATLSRTYTIQSGLTTVDAGAATRTFAYNTVNTFTATLAPALVTDLQFQVDGTVLGTAPVGQNGQATFTLPTPLSAGNHTLIVKFPGNAGYQPSADTVAITVTKATVAPQAQFVTAWYNQSYTLRALSAAPGSTVVFYIAGTLVGSATASASGEATLTLPAGRNAGLYSYDALHPGDQNYNAVKTSSTLQIRSLATSITTNSVTVNAGQAAVVTASLGLPGMNVSFLMNGTFVGSASTDANGNASFTFNGLAAGATHTYTARFIGSTNYLFSEAAGTITVNPAPIATSLSLEGPTTVDYGVRKDWYAVMSPAVAGKTVRLYFEGSEVAVGTTDASGTVYFDEIRLWTRGVRLLLTARFDGDATHLASASFLEVTVQ